MNLKQDILAGKAAHTSLIGDRKSNQDRCIGLHHKQCSLFALADGMGGHPRGERAAEIFIDTCKHYLSIMPQPIMNPDRFLTRLMHKAHESILTFGYDQSPPIDPRTTAVAVLIQSGCAFWAHAGDSRFYLLRHQRIAFRTTDHSYVERLRRSGLISANQQQVHPQRNYVTRCLGGTTSAPEVTLGKATLEAGDILLLCSDGLWGSISNEMISEALYSNNSLPESVRFLAQEAAQKKFPESDNVTLLSAQIIAQEQPTNSADNSTSAQPENLTNAIAELKSAIDNFQSKKETK